MPGIMARVPPRAWAVVALLAAAWSIVPQPAVAQTVRAEADDGHPQNALRPWSYRRTGDIRRFELRPGDRWSIDGTVPKERSEAYFPQKLLVGRTYRIGFGLLVEPGPPNDAEWLVLTQIQSTFRAGASGHSPPVALELKGDRLRIVSRTAIAGADPSQSVTAVRWTDAADLVRGRWYDLVLVVRLNPVGDGMLQVGIDHRQVVDYHGPLGFDEPIGAYLKQGIYRAAARGSIAARFSSPRIVGVPDRDSH